jgi:hypothetical protein
VCGSTRNLTIHHVEPIQPDRFVILCEECHVLAHKPIFRTMEVCVASGHFSIRLEAIVRRTDTPPCRTDMPAVRPGVPPSRTDMPALRPGMPPTVSGHSRIRPQGVLERKAVYRG